MAYLNPRDSHTNTDGHTGARRPRAHPPGQWDTYLVGRQARFSWLGAREKIARRAKSDAAACTVRRK